MYFTRCKAGKKWTSLVKIYYAKKGNVWGEAQLVNIPGFEKL